MKIQVQRGNQLITLTPEEAQRFAFKPGDHVAVVDHGAVKDVTVPDGGNLRIAFENGEVLLLPAVATLLSQHHAVVALGDEAVLVDPQTGKAETFQLLSDGDDDGPDQASGPADLQALPDVPPDNTDGLALPAIGQASRLPGIPLEGMHLAVPGNPLVEPVQTAHKAIDPRPLELPAGLTTGEDAVLAADDQRTALAPFIHNTTPDSGADLASVPGAAPGDDTLVHLLQSLPEITIEAAPAPVPVVTTGTPAPVITPPVTQPPVVDHPAPTPTPTPTPQPVPAPHPAPSGGGGSGGGSSAPSPPPPPPIPSPTITGLDPTTDTGPSHTDGVTSNATPTVVGTAPPHAQVKLMDGTTALATVTADATGAWAFTPAATSPLADGAHALTAITLDSSGRTSAPSAATTITIDTATPVAPVISGLTAATDTGASNTDGLTNLQTPAITGTTAPHATVEVFDGGTSLGTTVADATGKWTFTPAAPLVDGAHAITAQATSLAGTQGPASAPTTITVDTVPPATPVNNGLTPASDSAAADGITNVATPTITGTADPNTSVQILDGTTVLGTTTSDASGNWSFTPTAALADGAHALTAKAIDAAGNASPASGATNVTIDTAAPAAPAISGLTPATDTGASNTDALTKNTTPTLTGTTEPNATVTVFDGATQLGTATADGTGAWSFTPTTAFTDGVHAITAKATDVAGNTGVASAAKNVTIDTVAPAVPTVTGIPAAQDTGSSNSDGITSNTTPTISGTADPGTTVQLFDGATPLATVTADGTGKWSFTPGTALADGAHAITATATDAAGNTSAASAAKTVTIDTTAPAAAVVTGLTPATDTGTSHTDGITSDTTPTIAGRAEANAAIEVFDGGVLLGTTTADAGGNWTFGVTTPFTAGTHTVTAQATDAAGNVGPISAGHDIQILLGPPGPVITGLTPATDTGRSSTDDITQNTAPTLVGTAAAGTTIEVFDGGTSLGTTTADAGGNWTFTPAAPLAEGAHSITATSTDTAGTVSQPSAATTVTVDTTAPVAPVVNGLTAATDTGASNADGVTNNTTPTIQGAAESNASVQVFDGGVALGTATADATGHWTFTPSAPLSAGSHTITAQATDAAGNTGPVSAVGTIQIVTAAPATPVLTGLATGSDTGSSNTDGLTGNATPTIQGTATPGVTVQVLDGATVIGTTTADGAGKWSLAPAAPLSAGSHTLTAVATDLAGNQSAPSAAQTVKIDTTAPAAPVVSGLTPATDTGASSTDGVTSLATPTIQGTAEPNATVTVFDGTTQLGTATADGSGNWTFTPAAPLAGGTHGITAVATDAAGNSSPVSALAPVVVDTTAPAAPVVNGLTAATDTGRSNVDALTGNATPTIQGTAEGGATVRVLDGGVLLGTTTADGTGAWSFTPATALTDGAHVITAVAVDPAGNVGAASGAKTITIQTAPPTAPVVTGLTAATDTGASSTDGVTANAKPTITGTADPNATVQIFDGTTLVGTTTADGTGNWSLTPAAALAAGSHSITAKAIDVAGNASVASGAKTVTIDLNAPTGVAITGLATGNDTGRSATDDVTSNAAPTLVGTAPAGTTVQVFDGITSLGTATADGTGHWSLAIAAPLADGQHALTAHATDAGGNVSASSVMNLTIDTAAPGAPAIAGLTGPTDTGLSNTDGITKVATPTLQGTAEPNATVQIFDGTTQIGTTTADGAGNWTFTPATALADGPHGLTAVAVDLAGNTGPASASKTITIDTATPAAPTVTGLTAATDTGSSNSDGLTGIVAPTIAGTAEANSTVKVFDGTTQLGTTTADGSGNWTFTPAAPLASGAHTITATASDAAGNTSAASVAKAITIDATAPAAPTLAGITAATDTGSSNTDGITSNAKPTLAGTAEPNAIVKVFDGTTQIGTTTANGTGAWTFTPSTALSDGNHTLSAVALDAAGNASPASAAKTVVVDTTAPTSPVLAGLVAATDTGLSSTDGITKVATPTLQGTAEPNATVKVFDGATQIGTTTADGTGAWSFTPGTALAQGSHNLTAVAVDAAGNASPATAVKVVTVDTTAPAAPVLSGVPTASNDAKPTLAGTAEANATVQIFDGGALLGTTTADGTGAWSFIPTTPLAGGNHTLTAKAVDAAGNTSPASGASTLAIGTTPPTAPTISGLTTGSDSGASNTDAVTNVAAPTVTGTAPANATVQVYERTTLLGTTTADGTGHWSFTPGTPFTDGAHVLAAVAIDAAGNKSATSPTMTVTIDTGAPGAPTVGGLTPATDTGVSNTDGVTSNATPTIIGTAEPNAAVKVFDGATLLGTATADGAGYWSFTPGTALANGAHSVTATATDLAGNTSPASVVRTITIETAAPGTPTVTGLTAATDSGVSSTDATTNVATPMITGTADPNATVKVFDGGVQIGTTTSDASGKWFFVPGTALGDGAHSITAVFTDLVGNTSASSAAKSVTIDTAAPAKPVITGLTAATDTGASSTDGITKIAKPTIAGTAEANATIKVFDGSTQLGTATADGTGAWTFTPTTALADGVHVITAVAMDKAGNISPVSATSTVTVDTVAPAMPVYAGLTPATDTGTSNTDGITSNATPTLQGTAEPNATVQIFDGATPLATVTADSTGVWSYTPGTALASGTHAITVKATDLAGNVSPTTTATNVVIDATAPAQPVINGLTAATDLGTSNSDGLTSMTEPTLTGTAEANATVKVFDGGVLIGTTTAAAGGTWSFTPATPLGAGAHTITVVAVDAAGNASVASAAKTVTIDTTPPATPVVSGLTAATDTGTSNTDGLTSNATPTLQGTAEANATIKVFDGATQIGTTTADGTGAWTFTPGTALATGNHTITVTAMDAAGNTSGLSAAKTIGIFGTPGAPVITGLTGATDTGVSDTDGVTSNTKPTIVGTAAPNSVIKLMDGGATIATVNADAAGNWTYTPGSALTAGAHALTATATDPTGATSATSATKTITIDATAPAAPVVTGLTTATDTGSSNSDGLTAIAAPTLTGTAEANAVVQVFDGSTSLGKATADGSGNWSLTLATPLADGAHAITAKATDLAGNTGVASATKTITIDTGAPAVPVVTGLTAATDTGTSSTDGITSNTTPTLTGTAEANATVKLFDNGTLLATVTANGTGAWTYTPGTALASGDHVITAQATDAAGNVSAVSAGKLVTVDATAPAAPAITGLAVSSITGANPLVTDQTTPTIVGTAEPGATVKILDGATQIGSVTADAAGNWTFTPSTALTTAAHTLTATATDVAGNVSAASGATTITVSPTPPGAPVITGLTAATDSGISTTDGITNDTTPVLQGTAQANSVVTVFDGGTQIGTTIANGSGAWTFTPATALSNAAHVITVTATDAAGNVSPVSAAKTITVDTIAPAAPTLSGLTAATDTGASSTDGITNITKPTFAGTAEANATVSVYDGATLLGTATADGTGAWTYTPTVVLATGSHTITAKAMDAAGNYGPVSTAKTITIDPTIPTTPVINGLTAATDTGRSDIDAVTLKPTPTLTGTADPGITVNILDGATQVGTTTADASGNWSYTFGSALTDGAHSITAKAVDTAGNTATSAVKTVTVDTVAPVAPTITGLTAATDTGSSSTDGITSNTMPTVTGTAEANATVDIYDGTTKVGSGLANSSGAFSIALSSPLSATTHTLTAKATDAAGNTGTASAGKTVTVDLTPPGVPTVSGLAAASDTGISSTDGITSDTTPTINGTADPNTSVQVYRDGVLLSTVTSDGTGAWTYTPATAFTVGAHNITAIAVDTAGNQSIASSPLPVTIVTTAATPTFSGLSAASDTGRSSSDLTTKITTPSLYGSAGANVQIQIFDGTTQIGTTSTDTTGSWTFTPTTALAQGTHSITVKAVDSSGNTSTASAAKVVTIDTTAPVAPVVTGLATASDNGTSSSDNITSITNPQITGTSEANATIEVDDGTHTLGTTTANSSGVWTFNSSALSAGTHAITAIATDAAGNTGPASAAKTITIVGAPTAPTISGLAAGSDTGPSPTDLITTKTTPTIQGTAASNATVAVFDGATQLGTTTADSTGNWTYTPATALAAGTHSITAKTVDAAGNQSAASAAKSVNVDTTTPTVTAVNSPTNATFTPGAAVTIHVVFSENVNVDTSGGLPTLQLATGTTLEKAVYASGSGTSTLTFTYTVAGGDTSSDLNYVATNSLALNGGTITSMGGTNATLTLPGTTAANSLGGSNAIVINGTAGATPFVLGITAATDTGSSNVDGITSNTTPTVYGVGTAGATVTVKDGATTLGTTTADANGNWTFTPAAALAAGTHSITATVGTTSSAAKSITIDTTAPIAPTGVTLASTSDTGLSSTDAITTDTTPTITGTAEANATVKIYDGATLLGTVNAGTGAWTFTPGSALAAGVHSITATATDQAGNVGPASTAKTITIDTATPATPVITGLLATSDTGSSSTDGITTVTTPTIQGTAPANDTVQVYDGATLLGTTVASSTGSWSFTPASALTAGLHQITARAESTAGDMSAASAAKQIQIEANPLTAPFVTGLSSTTDTGISQFDGITTNTRPQIVGTAVAGSTVTVLDGTTVLGTTTATGAGDWFFTPSTALASGTHSITAKASDPVSGAASGASAAFSVQIDTTAPTVSSVTSSNANGTVGPGDTVSIQVVFSAPVTVDTSAGLPTLLLATGSTQEKAVYASGSGSTTLTFTYVVEKGDVSSDLNYAGTTSLALNGGVIMDSAGNNAVLTLPATTATTSLGGSKAIVVDTTAPATPVITGLLASTDTGTSSTDGITSRTAPTFQGTSEANVTIQFYENGVLLGSTTATSTGTWSAAPFSFANGTHSVQVKAVDAGGNASGLSSPYVIDIMGTQPAAPVITGLTAASDTGISSTDAITNDTTPTLSGTGVAGATIKVYIGSTLQGSTTVDADGNWTYTTAVMTPGSYNFTATQTDLAGNASVASTAKSVTIDTTAPVAAVVSGLTTATDTGTSNTDGITSNAKPAITGTAENNATVQVFDGATLLGTTTASSTGAWTFTPTVALSSGNHTITAKAEDAAGNIGPASTSKTITIIAEIATPVITGLTAASDTGSSTIDGITNSTTPAITGTAVANSTVTIKDGATVLGTTTASSSGAWTFTPATALAQGTHTITATASDIAGNTSSASAALSVVVDTTAPAAPVIAGLTAATDTGSSRTDGLTDTATPTLMGTTEANAVVQIFDGATKIGQTTADPAGNWTFTPGTALTQGAHTITAKAVDVAGNTGVASTAYTVTVDTTPPAAAVITGLTAATDTGTSSTDGITANNTPTLTGTAEANSTVQVFDGATQLGSTTADGTGAWSFTPANALADGAHTITAKAMDAAGNLGAASAAKTITVDTGAPATPLITGLTAATDTGASSTDGITSNTKPTLTGTAENNAIVQVYDGTTLLGTTTANGTGAWSYTPGTALAAGNHTITVVAVDAAGNASAVSLPKTVVIETGALATPVLSGLTTATDSGPSNTDGITNVAAPTFVGTATPNSTVQVLDGATVLGTATADGAGNWSFTPGTALADGAHAITVKATDLAGNTSPATAAKTITIDTGIPAAPVVTGLTPATDTGISTSDGITSNTAPVIAGTAEANATVKVFDGATLLGTATANGTGAWTFTPASALATGNHTITAVAVDAAGNTSVASAAKTVTIDTTAPATPTITGLTAATDTGSSSTDGITSNTTPTLTGTAEANATVKIYDGATVVGTTTADGTGAWSFTPATALAAGPHGFTAVAVDAAGNASAASAAKTVVIDATAPAAPLVIGLTAATDTGSSSTDGVTSNATPTLQGTAEANSTVKVFDGGTLLGTATADNAGNWTYTPGSAFTDGSHAITATATDASGNTSAASAARTITIAAAAPSAPVITGLTAATDLGASSTDGVTRDATPAITGTSPANATITVKDGAVVLGSTTADASGNWTFTPSAPLGDGSHSLTATFMDLAGHTSPASAAKSITIDTAAPATPTFTGLTTATDTGSSNTDGITKTAAPTLAGTAEANATVQVFDGTTLLGTTTASGTGAWTFTPSTALADGVHPITVVATDLAGNSSAASVAKAITIDTTAPSAPLVSGLTPATDTGVSNTDGVTSIAAPTLVGTAEANSTVKIFDGATLLGTTTADGAGNWSYTPAPLADGSHAITATATDAAGNVSVASANRTIVINTTAGATPTVVGLTAATDTGASSADGITRDAVPSITGLASANSTVKVFDGGVQIGTTTADASGNWTFTPSTPLPEGAHVITATFTDLVGHTSAVSPGYTVTVDLTAPTTPVVSGVTAATDTGASTTDGVTSNATPTITGTAEANAKITVFDGTTQIGTTTADGTGAWSFTPGTALSNGSHAITATATDAAGNVSAAGVGPALVIDTSAPAAPVVTGLTPATDTGVSNADGITSNATPTIVGTAEAGSTVQVLDGATLLGTATADTSGNWTFTPGAPLAVGTHSITAKATDLAGNVGTASTATTVTITPAGPAAPVIAGLTANTDTGSSSTDGVTRNARPAITGTAAANSTVQVFDGGVSLGTTMADSAGNWVFTPTAALVEGAHAITAKATDAAGNTSAASGVTTVTVDITAPLAPVLSGLTPATDTGISNTDGITSNATPTLQGTAEANALVQIFDGTSTVGTTNADGAGNWTFTPAAPLATGSHAFTAVAADLAGNASAVSATLTVQIQPAGPATPTIAGLTAATDTGLSSTDGITSNATPTLVGTAAAGATVQLFDGAAALGTVTADASGNWSFTPGAPLAQGSHSITATASDVAGHTSAASAATTITITTAAPTVPVVSGLTAATDTGSSNTDGITHNADPTLSGLAVAGATVKVFDGATALGTTTADGTGHWTFTPAAALADGTHTITAVATDAAGNTSPASAPATVVVDTAAPAVPVVTGLTPATDTGTSNTDGVTQNASPTIVGTAEANAAIQVFDGGTLLGTTTADGTGAWTYTPGTALATGSHAITAQATDAAGNVSGGATPYTVVIDASAAGVPVVSGLTPATDTGTSNTDGITSNTTPTITGSADANATVTVYDGATALGTTTADAAGVWTYTPATALGAGAHSITATETLASGNTSAASAAKTITIDTSTPGVPVVTGLTAATDTGVSGTDGITSNALPTFTGTAPASEIVQVFDGTTQLGSTTADGTGHWSFTPSAALGAGSHAITANAVDGVGHVSASSAAFALQIDQTAPAAPTFTGLTAATDTGSSSTDGITSNATPTFIGTAEANATIQIFDGSNPLGTTTADGTGAWSFTPGTALVDGSHSLSATATDAAGNVGASTVFRPITIDTAAPAAPTVTGLTPATDTGTNNHDGITANNTPTIVGTAEANATVKVYDGTNQIGTATADGTGHWSLTPGAPLAAGSHTITATATDTAGNTSGTSAGSTVTVEPAGTPAPYHLASVSSGSLWLGDFDRAAGLHAAAVNAGPAMPSQAPALSLTVHDVLALPTATAALPPLPGAHGGSDLVLAAHVPAAPAPMPVAMPPEAAPMLIATDILRHLH